MTPFKEDLPADATPFSWRAFYGRSFRILCLGSFVIIFFSWICFYLWEKGRNERQRGRLSFTKTIMRDASFALDELRMQLGHYPPDLDGKHYYGPLDNIAPGPFSIGSNQESQEVEPCGPIDPNRQTQIFPAEHMSPARYYSTRNPDGGVTYEGFSLRYFRPAHGRWALIVSNGPDLDEDWDMAFLSALAEVEDGEIMEELYSVSYDPTNGSESDGDVWRLVKQP